MCGAANDGRELFFGVSDEDSLNNDNALAIANSSISSFLSYGSTS